MLTRDEAWLLLCDWTPSEKLCTHAHAVELVMRDLASGLGQDVERFGLAGLLHDADYDRWPEEHPRRIVAWLGERGDEDLAHAISAHYTRWNVPCWTRPSWPPTRSRASSWPVRWCVPPARTAWSRRA